MIFELLLVLLTLGLSLLLLGHTMQAPVLVRDAMMITRVDSLLPQTQCGDCGFAGCKPYAQAMLDSSTAVTLCPPGGTVTANRLAALLGRSTERLGSSRPGATIARVDEHICIGCVKCITACPVDAIIGAAKQLHVVVPELCTGCQLCIPPCPVDCITMHPLHTSS